MEAAELNHYREPLLDQKEALRKQLTEMGADPDQENTVDGLDFDFGFADSAQSTAERNKVLAVIERLRENLHDVDLALGKIDKGTYGVCERCGEPISPERLEAIPYARLCMKCKQKESS
ncbi:MAG: TraR/DksA family transcriptional regulator [Actinomycetota bacterium]